jgi:hypothetical protein
MGSWKWRKDEGASAYRATPVLASPLTLHHRKLFVFLLDQGVYYSVAGLKNCSLNDLWERIYDRRPTFDRDYRRGDVGRVIDPFEFCTSAQLMTLKRLK